MFKKILKIIFSIITHLSIVVVIGCLAITSIQRSRGEQPNLFGYTIYVIMTDSMTGELEVGEAIISKKGASYEEGSIVTYISTSGALKGHPITHKVIRTYEENGVKMLQTCGVKKGAIMDVPIREDQVEGVMIRKLNVSTGVISFLQKPYVGLLLLIAPIMIYAVYEMYILIFSKKEN